MLQRAAPPRTCTQERQRHRLRLRAQIPLRPALGNTSCQLRERRRQQEPSLEALSAAILAARGRARGSQQVIGYPLISSAVRLTSKWDRDRWSVHPQETSLLAVYRAITAPTHRLKLSAGLRTPRPP